MNKLHTRPIHHSSIIVTKLIHDCYDESDIDKKIQMPYKINSLIPNICRIDIPSLITDTVLYTLVVNNMFCVMVIKRYFLCGSSDRK